MCSAEGDGGRQRQSHYAGKRDKSCSHSRSILVGVLVIETPANSPACVCPVGFVGIGGGSWRQSPAAKSSATAGKPDADALNIVVFIGSP